MNSKLEHKIDHKPIGCCLLEAIDPFYEDASDVDRLVEEIKTEADNNSMHDDEGHLYEE